MRLAQAGGPSVVADEDAAASEAPLSPTADRPPASKLPFIDAAARRNGLAMTEPSLEAPVPATLPRPEATPETPVCPAAPRL